MTRRNKKKGTELTEGEAIGDVSIEKYGATRTSAFWFLSFPYGETYSFPSFKAIIDYLAHAEKLEGSYTPRIIEGHVGTSYGHPFIKKDRTTRAELKEWMVIHDYTKEEIKKVMGRV